MTVLRARALDSQGNPVAGRTAVLEPWTGNRYRSSYSGPSAVRGLTAISGSDGWMSWTLPNLLRRPGPKGALWMVTGLEAQPVVLATQPTDTTTTGTRVGTVSPLGDLVPTPVTPVDTAAQATAAAQAAVGTVTAGAPASLDTLAEVAAELTGRLADVSLKAAFGRGVPGRRLAMLGDSLTAGVIGQPTPNADNLLQGSPLMYACMASQGRLEWGGQFGVPGETSKQILARVPQVVAAKPDMCIVLTGINDNPTSDTAVYLPQIIDALLAAGIEPVLATLPPSSSANALTTGPHNGIRLRNSWLTRYATKRGLRWVDFFGALVDPLTGLYKAGWNADITHPKQVGYRAMGEAVAAVLASQVKAGTSWLAQDFADAATFTGDGLFTTGTTAPGGWYVAAGTGFGSFVTDPYFLGRGFKMTRTGSGTAVVQKDIGTAQWNFMPGDLVAMSCKIKTTGLEASGGVATISIPNNSKTSGASGQVSWQIGADFPNGGVCYFESIIPPGTSGASIQLRIDGGNGAGDTFTVGQFSVRSLTRNGYTG
jgi:lysophospholipase L1-like esterase